MLLPKSDAKYVHLFLNLCYELIGYIEIPGTLTFFIILDGRIVFRFLVTF